jgi:hypothetical protein
LKWRWRTQDRGAKGYCGGGKTMKPTVRIENWRLINFRGKPRLYGDVCGHPRTGHEKAVVTSHILEIDEGLSKAETRNTIYLLGAKA